MPAFRATVEREGTGTFLRVPPEVVAELGTRKRPPVRVTVGGHTFRSTVAVYGDDFYLPLNAANREAAGVAAGDAVDVTIELDEEPRVVEVPDDLAVALAADADAQRRSTPVVLAPARVRRVDRRGEASRDACPAHRRHRRAAQRRPHCPLTPVTPARWKSMTVSLRFRDPYATEDDMRRRLALVGGALAALAMTACTPQEIQLWQQWFDGRSRPEFACRNVRRVCGAAQAAAAGSGRGSPRAAARRLGPRRRLRVRRRLEHQHRQRLLRRAAVLAQHVAGVRR